MIRPLFGIAILCCCSLSVPVHCSAQSGNAERQVLSVLNQMIDADKKDDAAELGTTLADDYMIVRDNGVVRDKALTLDGIRTGATKFISFDMSDLKVRIYGDTAVVTFLSRIKGSRAGQDMSGEFREVRVFVRRSGKWQAVHLQRTRVSS